MASAFAGLPLSGTGDTYDAQDALLVFKVAAIVEASAQVRGNLEIDHPAVQRLIEMRVVDSGWCGYRADLARDGAPVPEVTPTAVALYALSHVPLWRPDPACLKSLLWLSERLRAGSSDDVGDALGLLALELLP